MIHRAILFCGIMLLCSSAFSQVTCEEDRFRGTTECHTNPADIDVSDSGLHGANVIAAYSEGKYVLIFTFSSDGWKFLDVDRVYFLIGSERTSFDLHQVETNVESSTVIEQYGIFVPQTKLSRMAEGNVEFQIGYREFVMPKKVLSKLPILIEKTERKK